jgi:hypothetical protein
MFWSLASAKGEELLKTEPLVLKTLITMCGDNNWKMRREAAENLSAFLMELNTVTKQHKTNQVVETKHGHTNSFALFGSKSEKTDIANAPDTVVSHAKLSKQRFKDDFYELMVDFMADQELLVRVEAIEMYVEHM